MIENFEFGRIVVVGDILLDQYITGTVRRVSPEAPVPVLVHEAQRAVPGGAANVAANAAALGAKVVVIGVVGEDAAAEMLRKVLRQWRLIDASSLIVDPSRTTITKTRVVCGRQQIVRIDSERLDPLEDEVRARLIRATRAAIKTADVVVCSDYAKGVLCDEVLRATIDAGRSRGIPVIVDPKRPTFEAYQGATLVTPNRQELGAATGLPLRTNAEIERAAEAASRQFGGDVLVTRSEAGMTLWRRDGGKPLHVSARKSEVFDVSGAGDTVVATVASMLAAEQSLESAVVISAAAAAISVNKVGTATVSREELSNELRAEMRDTGTLVSPPLALKIVENWRHHGARVVLTNGCFDLLHPGHVSLIKAAAREGDKLIVALNSDRSVSRLKGSERPIQDEHARAMIIGALRQVDLVVLFEEDTPLELIKLLKPDVLVKGADYAEDQVVGGDVVKANGGRVVLVDLMRGRSTTSLVHKMRGEPADVSLNRGQARSISLSDVAFAEPN